MYWLTIPILGIFMSILTHHFLRKLMPDMGVLFSYVASGFLFGVGVIVAAYTVYGVSVSMAAAVLIYALAAELYIFLFSMVTTSISSSIIMRIADGADTDAVLETHFSGQKMVQRRFTRMVETDLLQFDGNAYSLSEKGRRLLNSFSMLRNFFRHDRKDQG